MTHDPKAILPSVAPPASPPQAAVPSLPSGISADQLLATIDAMQAELDNLRGQNDARKYHMEQVERELRLASRLQKDFLPKKLPNHGNVKFDCIYQPAGHVSGDLYDVRRLDEHHVGVYLADAIGHGMPAALLAMFMHNALQTKQIDATTGRYRLLDSSEAMGLLNETLASQGLEHATFATALYAKVHVTTGQVEFARGGHPLPILLRGDGPDATYDEIGGDGALLGVMADETFEPCELTLAPGDRLILFTDGVEAAFVPPGATADLEAWRKAVRERMHLPAAALLSELRQRVEGRPADDDVTILSIAMT